MHRYVAELHVHTVLSPCAEVEMIPPLIVSQALERGINLIAITDHNASANVSAVLQAAHQTGLAVLSGMELETQEEVHLLCLFDTFAQLAAWQARVDRSLPPLENNPEYFGEQFVVDETGDFIRRENRLLITAATISFDDAVREVTSLGGMAIPAHVDRQAYGLIANLGFIPTTVNVEALEISRHLKPADALARFPQLHGYPLLQGGDAHRLDEMVGANEFYLAEPTIAEIRSALLGKAGRSVLIRCDV